MLENRLRRCSMLGGLLGPLLLQACSGPEGAAGPTGPEGAIGPVAHHALLDGQHFDTLAGCPRGGVVLSMGTDDGDGDGTAGNGVLEAGEIDDTENLCDGPVGPGGDAGPGGPDGASGATGGTGSAGATGPGGAAGPTGSAGAAGPTGSAGATGATGAAGDAEPTLGFAGLVSYASGDPIELTIVDGIVGDVALPAFGTWASFDTGGDVSSIDLTGTPGTLLNTAFTVPADGTITGLSAFFSTTTTLVLGASSIQYGVALYAAAAGENTFEAILDSVQGFTDLTGTLLPGTADSLLLTPVFPIAVEAGSRILMVVAASSTDLTLDATVSGYFSGSLQFEETTD